MGRSVEPVFLGSDEPFKQNAGFVYDQATDSFVPRVLQGSNVSGVSYYLDPANGDDDNDGLSPDTAFATLPIAYAALTADQNDILYYIAGPTGINLAAVFDWHKDYTHLVGICAPTGIGARARIFQLSSATSKSPLVTISAKGCVWSNIEVFQGVANAASLVAVSVTGVHNYFYRCQFAGGGATENAIDNCASLQLDGAAENLFEECVLGQDTVALATGGNVIRLVAQTARNYFKNCIIQALISNTNAALLEATLATSLDRWMIFEKCLFLSESVNDATVMASAFVIPAATITSKYILKDCASIGCTTWDVSKRGRVYGNMNAVTGAALGGVLVKEET